MGFDCLLGCSLFFYIWHQVLTIQFIIKKRHISTQQQMKSSRQPLNPQPKQDFSKVIAFFHHNIPTNFLLTQRILYGECLVTQSSPTFQLLSKRKRCRYLANTQQIMLMFLQDGSSQRLTRHHYLRILYQQVISIKLSVYYCGIILNYSEYNGSKEREKYSICIEAVDIGLNKGEHLRQFLIKCIGGASRNGGAEKFQSYCEWTLLDFQMEGWEEDEESQKAVNQDQDRIIGKNQIRATKTVNLKKKKEEAAKYLNGISEGQKGIKENKTILSRRYKVYSQISFVADKKQPLPYRFYLSQKQSKSSKKPESQNLSTLKLIPLQSLSSNPNLLQQTLSQCTLHKSYQLITPYISQLNKVFLSSQHLILQYKYFEGCTLRQLMKKQKIDYGSYQKKFMKQLIAQIVCLIGHVHQCGVVVDGVGLDWVMVGVDGLVGVVPGVANMTKIGKQAVKDNIGMENVKKKDIRLMSPEQMLDPFRKPSFESDWWSLGMLLYQMLNRYNYFDNFSQQKIKKQLTHLQVQLDFSSIDKKIQKNPDLQTLIKNLLHKDLNQRLGTKNDYHTVLDMPYFKGIDKNKLMKRQTQPLMKIRKVKLGKQIHLQENVYRNEMEMKEMYRDVRNALEEVVFDRDMEFQ